MISPTRRPITIAGACFLLGGMAVAAELPITGSYGNIEGCAYALRGESSGSDDFFLLTKDAVTTAVAHCRFLDVRPRSDKGFDVTAQCEEEGWTEDLAPFEVEIELVEPESYVLNIDDGSQWGPLALCR